MKNAFIRVQLVAGFTGKPTALLTIGCDEWMKEVGVENATPDDLEPAALAMAMRKMADGIESKR